MLEHRLKQILRVNNIAAEVQARIFHTLACLDQRGKVGHGVEVAHLEQRIECVLIGDVALYEIRTLWYCFTVSAKQAVEDSNLMSRLQEHGGGCRADITSAAR